MSFRQKALVWCSDIQGQIEIGSFYRLHSITYKSRNFNIQNLLDCILIVNSIKTDHIVDHDVIESLSSGFTNISPLADFVGIDKI